MSFTWSTFVMNWVISLVQTIPSMGFMDRVPVLNGLLQALSNRVPEVPSWVTLGFVASTISSPIPILTFHSIPLLNSNLSFLPFPLMIILFVSMRMTILILMEGCRVERWWMKKYHTSDHRHLFSLPFHLVFLHLSQNISFLCPFFFICIVLQQQVC